LKTIGFVDIGKEEAKEPKAVLYYFLFYNSNHSGHWKIWKNRRIRI